MPRPPQRRLAPAPEPSRGGPLTGWLGQRLSGARDSRGVYAVDRYYDLAIDSAAAAEPSSRFHEHVMRRPSRGLERFAPEAQERLKAHLGHFHQAQSLDSADALVWNFFAPFSRPRTGARWLNEILAAAFGPQDYPKDWMVRLWHREEVTLPGMPATIEVEAPVTAASSGGWKYVVAAQWQDDFPEGVADPFSLHVRQLAGEDSARQGLMVVVPSPAHYPPAHDAGSVFSQFFGPHADGYLPTSAGRALAAPVRVVTWESLGERADVHPHGVELRAMTAWRLAQLSGGPP